MTPMPPACAIATASRASVTVSIAEEMIGTFRRIDRVSLAPISTWLGITVLCPGRNNTSSKAKPSENVELTMVAMSSPSWALRNRRSRLHLEGQGRGRAAWHGLLTRAIPREQLFIWRHQRFVSAITAATGAKFALRRCSDRRGAPKGGLDFLQSPHAARSSHSAHHRNRPVHGKYGRDGALNLAAGDRARSPAGSDRSEIGADRLYADAGNIHSGQRLGRRPFWRAHRFLLGDRRLHNRIGALRRLQLAGHADRRPRLPGRRP